MIKHSYKLINHTLRINTKLTLIKAYHSNIIDHYENPRNVGTFNKTESRVGTGLVGAPACGDVMKITN